MFLGPLPIFSAVKGFLGSLFSSKYFWYVVVVAAILFGFWKWGYVHGRDVQAAEDSKEITALVRRADALKDELDTIHTQFKVHREATERVTLDLRGTLAEKEATSAAVIARLKKETENVRKFISEKADRECPVPDGFVRLLDLPTPAGQNDPSRGDSGNADAPSGVALSEVGAVVSENYRLCLQDRERLTSWQLWYKTWAEKLKEIPDPTGKTP